MSVVQEAAAVDRLAASFDQAKGQLLQPAEAPCGGGGNLLAGPESGATTTATSPSLQAAPGSSHAPTLLSTCSSVDGNSSSSTQDHGEHQGCLSPPHSTYAKTVGVICPSKPGCAHVQQPGAITGPGQGHGLLPCGSGAGWAQDPGGEHVCHVSDGRVSDSSGGGSGSGSLDEEGSEELEQGRDDRPPVWLQVRERRTAGMWCWRRPVSAVTP